MKEVGTGTRVTSVELSARRAPPHTCGRYETCLVSRSMTCLDSGWRGRPRRVLVVDDSEDARTIYQCVLVHAGYDVATASDGSTALEMAPDFRPDVILLDFAMPNMDGLEVLRRLADDRGLRDVPVVVTTACAHHAPLELQTACSRFLAKPCLPDEIVAAVNAADRAPRPC
jgi:CheY-like chemotaxis protein